MIIRRNKLLQIIPIISVLFVACGLINPEDGFVHATATVTGAWPESAVGIRLAAKTIDPNGYLVVSEVLLTATEEIRSTHSAKNDTTILATDFSLPPDRYYFFVESLERHMPFMPGTYFPMDLSTLNVESGKSGKVRLSGSFQILHTEIKNLTKGL